jgi:hypothetical protein
MNERARLAAALGNEHYRGGVFGWLFLIAVGAMNLFRGSVHTFKADGGASSIAGIDLSQNGEVILTLFAAAGITQLLMAAIDFTVALRLRALVPWLVGYHLVHQVMATLVVWWWRPLPLDAPGKFGAAILVPIAGVALASALRSRREVSGELAAARG